MTQKQLLDRETVVQKLAEEGWQDTAPNRLFEQGKSVRSEARMTYHNVHIKLTATYFANKEMIYFGIYEPSGKGISIATYFEDKLHEYLRLITSFQDNISALNFRAYFQEILRDFPQTYAEIDENLVPLLDDSHDE